MKVGDRYGGERIVVVEDPRAATRRPKAKVVTPQATVRVQRRVVPAAPSGGAQEVRVYVR